MTDFERAPRIGLLASGEGTTIQAYLDAIAQGYINAEVAAVVSSKEDAGVLARTKKANDLYGFDIQSTVINGKTHPEGKIGRGQTLEESMAISDLMDSLDVDLVVAMGYMRIINGPLLEQYGWHNSYISKYLARLINTHPAPIPETADTHGVGAAQRVLDLGLHASKHTVHLVSAEVDAGPIIAEHEVPIKPGDTAEILSARTQVVEKKYLPYDIDGFWQEQQVFRADLSN